MKIQILEEYDAIEIIVYYDDDQIYNSIRITNEEDHKGLVEFLSI